MVSISASDCSVASIFSVMVVYAQAKKRKKEKVTMFSQEKAA